MSSAAAAALVQHWRPCPHTGHTNSSLLGLWDSESTISEPAFGKPLFLLPMRQWSPSQTAHWHGTGACPAPPAVNPPQHEASHHTCFIHSSFPNTRPNLIHKLCLEWDLQPGHANAQPWPYVFLSWGYHLVVSCGSLHTQRGAKTLLQS